MKKDNTIILVSVFIMAITVLLVSVAYTIKIHQNYRIDRGRFYKEILKGDLFKQMDLQNKFRDKVEEKHEEEFEK